MLVNFFFEYTANFDMKMALQVCRYLGTPVLTISQLANESISPLPITNLTMETYTTRRFMVSLTLPLKPNKAYTLAFPVGAILDHSSPPAPNDAPQQGYVMERVGDSQAAAVFAPPETPKTDVRSVAGGSEHNRPAAGSRNVPGTAGAPARHVNP